MPGRSKACISRFFADVLRAPLRNARTSWGAEQQELDLLVLRVWRDEIISEPHNVKVHVERLDTRFGQRQRREHLDQMRKDRATIAVVCTPKFSSDGSRAIKDYDAATLLLLGKPWRRADGHWFAPITDQLPTASLQARFRQSI